jgi:hypothetical protein
MLEVRLPPSDIENFSASKVQGGERGRRNMQFCRLRILMPSAGMIPPDYAFILRMQYRRIYPSFLQRHPPQ